MYKNPKYVYGEGDILVPASLNFGEFLLKNAWSFGDKTCLINGVTNEKITYREIAQQAMNTAVSLRQLGMQKGQVVAICSENRNEFFGTVVGILCAGGVVTTLNIGYTKGELKHVMGISKPKYIFCSPFTYKIHAKTIKSLDYLKKTFLYGNETIDNCILFNDLAVPNNVNGTFSGLQNNVIYNEFACVDVDGYDIAGILYSSGTTGLPKGVMLTNLNLLTACSLPSSHALTQLSLTITPWYHVMGLVGNLAAISIGRTAIYLPKFELDLYLRLIEQYKISALTVVPPVLVAITKADIKYDMSSVELIYSGAAPLLKDTLDGINQKFPKAVVLQGYGMTEVTLAITRDTYEMAHRSKLGSVGYAVAGTIFKVVDIETRKPVGVNQKGEICIKGPLVMKGYVGKENKDDFDEEGFFKTGDIGYYDEDRCFYVVDRLKELIKYKGFQVPPAEIEAVLLQHEGVKDVGVIGIPHKTAGEVPLAYVVKQPGANVTEKEIMAFVAERLSNPKHLRGGVRFISEIPKNPTGKILRKVLRSMSKTDRSKL